MDGLFKWWKGDGRTSTTTRQASDDYDIGTECDVDENDFEFVHLEAVQSESESTTMYKNTTVTKTTYASSTTQEKTCEQDNLRSSPPSVTEPAAQQVTSITDVPMQLSKHVQTIHMCQMAVNHRKLINLALFNYDFSLEISVLEEQVNDT